MDDVIEGSVPGENPEAEEAEEADENVGLDGYEDDDEDFDEEDEEEDLDEDALRRWRRSKFKSDKGKVSKSCFSSQKCALQWIKF